MAATFPLLGLKACPSIKSIAENFPGPHRSRIFLRVGSLTCNRLAIGSALSVKEIMPPTSRSRFGHPSNRLPIPSLNELSTVEWQTAQVIPIDCNVPSWLKFPFTPTTEFNFKRANVIAGSFKSIEWEMMPSRTSAGNASTSTFNPIPNAAAGLTPGPKPPLSSPAIALSICSNPLQKSSSPKVSKRNVSLPCAINDFFFSIPDCSSSAATCSVFLKVLEH